jgi:hypothetical protein
MDSLRNTLGSAESKVGIPIMVKEYDELGKDIKEYAEEVWPELADWALADFATKIHLDITYRSPIEQKMKDLVKDLGTSYNSDVKKKMNKFLLM